MNLVSSSLDFGERQPIDLALHLKADLLLMDDRAGVEEARRLGRFATGTLGILARGAEREFVSLPSTLEKLQQANFRVRPGIIRELLAEDAAKSKGRN